MRVLVWDFISQATHKMLQYNKILAVLILTCANVKKKKTQGKNGMDIWAIRSHAGSMSHGQNLRATIVCDDLGSFSPRLCFEFHSSAELEATLCNYS